MAHFAETPDWQTRPGNPNPEKDAVLAERPTARIHERLMDGARYMIEKEVRSEAISFARALIEEYGSANAVPPRERAEMEQHLKGFQEEMAVALIRAAEEESKSSDEEE